MPGSCKDCRASGGSQEEGEEETIIVFDGYLLVSLYNTEISPQISSLKLFDGFR
jgi:hypothetical protein